jgi:hypothetical protein
MLYASFANGDFGYWITPGHSAPSFHTLSSLPASRCQILAVDETDTWMVVTRMTSGDCCHVERWYLPTRTVSLAATIDGVIVKAEFVNGTLVMLRKGKFCLCVCVCNLFEYRVIGLKEESEHFGADMRD